MAKGNQPEKFDFTIQESLIVFERKEMK